MSASSQLGIVRIVQECDITLMQDMYAFHEKDQEMLNSIRNPE
jgi:hypothetical protein